MKKIAFLSMFFFLYNVSLHAQIVKFNGITLKESDPRKSEVYSIKKASESVYGFNAETLKNHPQAQNACPLLQDGIKAIKSLKPYEDKIILSNGEALAFLEEEVKLVPDTKNYVVYQNSIYKIEDLQEIGPFFLLGYARINERFKKLFDSACL